MRLLFISLLALLCGLAPQGMAMADTKESDALRNEIAALRAQLTARDARIEQLEAVVNASAVADVSGVLAASNGDGKGGVAPSSTLDWASATKVATAVRYMVPGSKLVTVMPTGSMKPVFDERSMLVLEPAPFDSLQVGDIVTYRHPQHGMPVVHRITEKRGDKFWSKGDNNSRMDEVYITRENYEGRVFSIIYSKEPSELAKRFGGSARKGG